MKKFIVFCIALLMIGIGTTRTVDTADAAFSKDEVVKARFALKKERLAEIVSKKIAHVEQSIKTKLKEQEAKKVQKQKEEEKKATEKKEAEEKAAEAKAEHETAPNTVTENQEDAPNTAVPEEQQQAPSNDQGADAVSGASSNWQERKQKGQEWGERLRDPNLTPEERQGIIQEKKNYYRNNH
ncbi:hypothetical protein [Candidatus Enterococcus mansonii]|uniref:Uncharacterized protein n=1 Tax=Candidatus Enterococcus mansonii TaxID=1834181 RepID=A0A242CH49_9ENTE|nr:hypothetical protein [Enterococcus sp. 4G2_DIV0659]OTO09448.1 hypothetical protein A5880_000127 [Enterococcus sp. 4G2_DIV0659]